MDKIVHEGSLDIEYAKKRETMKSKELQKTFWERDNLNKRRKPSHPVIRTFAESKITEIEKNSDLLEVGAGNGFFLFI